MAAVGLPCWTPHVWADTVWALGVWRDATTPPPPPPEVASEDLQGGWLAPTARWRGWQAPPRRQKEDDDASTTGQEDSRHARPAPGALSSPDAGTHDGAAVADTRFALLSTARALPPLDWAPLQALAQADATRRQAQAARGEEEELLVLLMLGEEV